MPIETIRIEAMKLALEIMKEGSGCLTPDARTKLLKRGGVSTLSDCLVNWFMTGTWRGIDA